MNELQLRLHLHLNFFLYAYDIRIESNYSVSVVKKARDYTESDTYVLWRHLRDFKNALLTGFYCKNKYGVVNDIYRINPVTKNYDFRDEFKTENGIEIKSLSNINDDNSGKIELYSEECMELYELINHLTRRDY